LSSDQNKWYVANKLSFNIEKTCYSAFLNDPSNRNDYSSINLKINAAKIKMCDSVKYLEVWIDDKLNWKIHIDYIYLKLAKFVGLFYKLSHELPPNCLKMLYFSFAHPHILYGVEIYVNTYTSYLDKLLKLNNKLLRILQQKDNYCRNIELYIIFYLLPNFIIFKYFVLFTILFTIKNYCQRFIIIILLRTITFMIMIQEIKIICTCQLLIFVTGPGQ